MCRRTRRQMASGRICLLNDLRFGVAITQVLTYDAMGFQTV